jgi:arsenate reductase-like glutaredoxin family protein
MLREPRLVRRPLVRIGGDVHFGADSRVLAELLK